MAIVPVPVEGRGSGGGSGGSGGGGGGSNGSDDAAAAALLELDTGGGALVVPVAVLEGEAESDESARRHLLGLGGDCGEGDECISGGSGTALGRQWAALRLLLSLVMRESGEAIYVRWCRDRLADTSDDRVAPAAAAAAAEGAVAGPTRASEPTAVPGVTPALSTEKYPEAAPGEAAAAAATTQTPETTSTNVPAAALAAEAALATEVALATGLRLQGEWSEVLDDAATSKRSLLPEHVWVLANLLRRPILVSHHRRCRLFFVHLQATSATAALFVCSPLGLFVGGDLDIQNETRTRESKQTRWCPDRRGLITPRTLSLVLHTYIF